MIEINSLEWVPGEPAKKVALEIKDQRVLKPLDLVKTPNGSFAIITERSGKNYSIRFIGPSNGDKNAWWSPFEGLEYLDNLPRILSIGMCHPFGDGRAAAEEAFK